MSATTTYYTFDASQRLIRQQLGTTEVHYFTYNQRNMLTQVQDYVVGGGGDTNRYFAYNGLGERVFGIDGTTNPSYWTYDGSTLLSENVDGNMNQFRHNKGRQDATTGGSTECVTSDTTPVYAATDVGGSANDWTCDSTDSTEVDAFGVIQGQSIGITGAPPVQRLQWRIGEGVLGIGTTQDTNLLTGGNAVLNGASILLVGAGGLGFLGSVMAGLGAAVGPGIFEDRRVATRPPRPLDGWFVDSTPAPTVPQDGYVDNPSDSLEDLQREAAERLRRAVEDARRKRSEDANRPTSDADEIQHEIGAWIELVEELKRRRKAGIRIDNPGGLPWVPSVNPPWGWGKLPPRYRVEVFPDEDPGVVAKTPIDCFDIWWAARQRCYQAFGDRGAAAERCARDAREQLDDCLKGLPPSAGSPAPLPPGPPSGTSETAGDRKTKPSEKDRAPPDQPPSPPPVGPVGEGTSVCKVVRVAAVAATVGGFALKCFGEAISAVGAPEIGAPIAGAGEVVERVGELGQTVTGGPLPVH